MLLVIDVGNTTTVIGLYDGDDAAEANSAAEGLLDHWRIATTAERTADELSVAIRSFLDSRLSKDPWAIQGIAVSSGVPRITSALRDMSTRYFEVDPVVIEPGVRTGIAISTDNPRGRSRPHRQRRGRLAPLRRSDGGGRLRHRHHLRRHLVQGRIPRRRHRSRRRHQP